MSACVLSEFWFFVVNFVVAIRGSDAEERMATVGRAILMGESSQGTQAQVRAVATREREGGHAEHEQVAPRQVQSFQTTRFLENASSSTAEPQVVSAEATEEVRRLEATVLAFGDGNANAKPLLKALVDV